MDGQAVEQERADFERVMRKRCLLGRDATGRYVEENTRAAWVAWLERAVMARRDVVLALDEVAA